ncbi:MAG: hypothetical protein QXU99_01615 [Candidatus Bathyarchaeia archaeon]
MVQTKKLEETQEKDFVFRVKLGESEIELKGTYNEVTKTIQDLPNLFANIRKALESVKPKTVATITVKAESARKEAPTATADVPVQSYPQLPAQISCDEAILRILESDWGKWRPRTLEEIQEVMKANNLQFMGRMLNAALDALVEKGNVRRWNTNAGFVYILAEKKTNAEAENK